MAQCDELRSFLEMTEQLGQQSPDAIIAAINSCLKQLTPDSPEGVDLADLLCAVEQGLGCQEAVDAVRSWLATYVSTSQQEFTIEVSEAPNTQQRLAKWYQDHSFRMGLYTAWLPDEIESLTFDFQNDGIVCIHDLAMRLRSDGLVSYNNVQQWGVPLVELVDALENIAFELTEEEEYAFGSIIQDLRDPDEQCWCRMSTEGTYSWASDRDDLIVELRRENPLKNIELKFSWNGKEWVAYDYMELNYETARSVTHQDLALLKRVNELRQARTTKTEIDNPERELTEEEFTAMFDIMDSFSLDESWSLEKDGTKYFMEGGCIGISFVIAYSEQKEINLFFKKNGSEFCVIDCYMNSEKEQSVTLKDFQLLQRVYNMMNNDENTEKTQN